VSADLVALDALKAWIDLVRFKRVTTLFSDGFQRTQPLLEQIKSVSTSGLTDKKSLLASQRQIMELQDRFLAAQSMRKVSEEIFLDSFPGANLSTVVDTPSIEIEANDVFGSYDLETIPSIQEKLLLITALKLNIAGLEASDSPQVAFRASVNAPLDNTLDDGVANAGFNLTYDFNDGGSREAQVAQVKAELDILKSEIGALKNGLKVEYSKQAISYETSRTRIDALRNLIKISQEIKETAQQQLLSGRSTIKDVLDAEVSLSSLKIDQVNAEADILITLLSAKAYKDGLTQTIGWSY
jgi:outer membrane protein TolC